MFIPLNFEYLKLYKPTGRPRSSVKRCINVWNSLSEKTRAYTSISAFKQSRILQFISFSIRFQILLTYLFQGIRQCFHYVYVSWHLPFTVSYHLSFVLLF